MDFKSVSLQVHAVSEVQGQSREMVPTPRLHRRRISGSVNWSASNYIDHLTSLSFDSDPFARHTNIVCTIGPSTHSLEMLCALLKAGMNVARLNFSHGSHEYHENSIKMIRTAEKMCGLSRPLAIALDTKGPEIRTGMISPSDGFLTLEIGDSVTVTTDKQYEENTSKEHIFVSYERITKVLKVNDKIFIDDGMICLVVGSISGCEISCEVEDGGKLGSRKGVNLPNAMVDLPTLSEKDIDDLGFGVRQRVDYIFASFIRGADGVREIRRVLGKRGSNIKIVAKLENLQGIQNLSAIIEEADGIMVARGDLGIEIPAPKVFVAQKIIISKCNLAGKPVICATQMLGSMTEQPRATRAEVSDVANAVLDGADCIMLSGETAKGKYPVQCVELMDQIARQAESCMFYKERFHAINAYSVAPISVPDATAIAAVEASFKVHAPIIIVLTYTGQSARLISKYQPRSIIMVVTRFTSTARSLNLYRGCHSVIFHGKGNIISTTELLNPVTEDEEMPFVDRHNQQADDWPDHDESEEEDEGDAGSSSKKDMDKLRFTKLYHETNMSLKEWFEDMDNRIQYAMNVAKKCHYVITGDEIICVTGSRGGAGYTNTVRILKCK